MDQNDSAILQVQSVGSTYAELGWSCSPVGIGRDAARFLQPVGRDARKC